MSDKVDARAAVPILLEVALCVQGVRTVGQINVLLLGVTKST
jgi:hypothetical protein